VLYATYILLYLHIHLSQNNDLAGYKLRWRHVLSHSHFTPTSSEMDKQQQRPLQVFADDKTGECLAYDTYMSTTLLHSIDGGKTFYQLKLAGFSGDDQDHHLTALDPHQQHQRISVKRLGPVVSYDGRFLLLLNGTTPTIDPSKAIIVSLPTVRSPQYLFQSTSDKITAVIYVSADEYTFSYQSFKLFVGHIDAATPMQQIKIKDVQRYRDGGTTFIYTASGTLFSPVCRRISGQNESVATWNGAPVIRLNPKDYHITETPEGIVRITKNAQDTM
jgi:hypothetical protein